MNWNAAAFFRTLTEKNILASRLGFIYCDISGLEGLEEVLQHPSAANFVCVSDISDGYIELSNSPKARSVKTVFMAMRHKVDDMKARAECFDIMREIFRQFMSRLIREKVKIEENFIYLDSNISFTEIDRYFFNGAACAFFQIAVDVNTDLRLRHEEWASDADRVFAMQFNESFS